jgi:hypothetical protein
VANLAEILENMALLLKFNFYENLLLFTTVSKQALKRSQILIFWITFSTFHHKKSGLM